MHSPLVGVLTDALRVGLISAVGFLDVGHFCGYMEHSGGFMLQVTARYQLFTVQQRTYGVLRIDSILAEDRTRTLQGARVRRCDTHRSPVKETIFICR